MDPKACLLSLESAIIDEDADTANELAESYRGWRKRGGFEPAAISGRVISDLAPCRGDMFFTMLLGLLAIGA